MAIPIDVRVGHRLRKARIAAGLTQREAAARAGIPDHSLLGRYENGIARPPLDRLEALAHAYNLTLSALLAEREELVDLIAAIERADEATIRELLIALERVLAQ